MLSAYAVSLTVRRRAARAEHQREQEQALIELRAEQAQSESESVISRSLAGVQSEHQRSQDELEEQRSQRRELEEELAGREVESEDLRQSLRTAQSRRDQVTHELDSLRSKHDLQLDEARQQLEQFAELDGRHRGLQGQLDRAQRREP